MKRGTPGDVIVSGERPPTCPSTPLTTPNRLSVSCAPPPPHPPNYATKSDYGHPCSKFNKHLTSTLFTYSSPAHCDT